LPGKNWRRG